MENTAIGGTQYVWGKRLLYGFIVLFFVFLIGIIGFKYFGSENDSWVDSFFMAAITLTTVGYGERTALETDCALIFASLYVVSGMGVFLFVITTGTAFIVEGEARRLYWDRRIRKMIDQLQNHFILCGVGRQGTVVANEFYKTGRPFVMVEGRAERAQELYELMPDIPVVVGDATENQVLLDAGIEKAQGLIACLEDDRDNLLLIVTAKQIKPTIRIVCKVMDVQHMKKLNQAGADSVVSPTLIGGLRMASEMIRPVVVTFLDKMLRDKDRTLRIEEISIPLGSRVKGHTLDELDLPQKVGMVVVAIKQPQSEQFIYAPTGDTLVEEEMTLVVIGDVKSIPTVESLVQAKA